MNEYEIQGLVVSNERLVDALRSLRKLIEEGDLVRNMQHDSNIHVARCQGLRITEALAKTQKALSEQNESNP